jgi:methyl-accepting chemotaxis protein
LPEKAPSRNLPQRLTILVVFLWAVIALFSYLFVTLIFTLGGEQKVTFSLVFFILAGAVCALSVLYARRLCRPLVDFVALVESGEDVAENLADEVSRSSRTLYMKLGLVGFIGPLGTLFVTALLLQVWAELTGSQVFYFVILGLFDSMFVGALLFLLPQMWLGDLQEILTKKGSGVIAGRVVSLRLKMVILGFAMATVPTLLVGAMSFFTANRLLGNEMGSNLSAKLVHVNKEVGSLAVSGLGRADIENYLSDEADKLGPGAYMHFGSPGAEFYRSGNAEPLPAGLYERISEAKEESEAGTVLEPSSGTVYAYAFSPDGKWVSIAPIQSTVLSRATQSLFWLIVGITLASMFMAAVISFFFASNIGTMVKRMAGVTEEVARGDLTQEVGVISDDELGVLGASLSAMNENLRRMVKDVTELGGQIASTCNQLLVKASAISTGADLQSQSVHETSESIEDLNGNIQSASDNLQALAQSSQETAEAAQKVGESFNLMLAETGSLQRIVERTGEIAARMVASVLEVAGSIKELSQGAERSALSMTEMDRSISEVSSSAADTAQIARKAIDVAQEGAVAVRRTIEGMDRIQTSTRDASGVIVGLGDRIEAIGSILGVIDEIADQTNLLALNAAIIAAQAGEHGRGFAVVADEIRSLAERTASSTREIAQMIGDIQETSEQAIKVMKGGEGTVNEGVSLAKKAGDALNQILVSFQKAAENVESIAGYTEGQAKSSETVAKEIGHVAEMASRISTAASEQSRAGDELQASFQDTMRTSQSLGKMVNQQAQENRQAIAAVAEMNEATTRANAALLDQSKVSDGILQAIEQIREIAKNHAKAASEMGEATKSLAEKSAQLKEEIDEFHV